MVIVAALCAPQPGHAQEREGLSLDILGGGVGTFQHLNSSGTAYLNGGPFFGAVLDYAPSSAPGLALLGEVAWTHHQLLGSAPGAGTNVELFSAGGDVGYIFVDNDKFSSAFFGGGGVLLISERTTTAAKLKPFSRLGLDARYRISSKISLYAQVSGMIYTLSNFPSGSVLEGYDHHQGEGSIGAGVTVRF